MVALIRFTAALPCSGLRAALRRRGPPEHTSMHWQGARGRSQAHGTSWNAFFTTCLGTGQVAGGHWARNAEAAGAPLRVQVSALPRYRHHAPRMRCPFHCQVSRSHTNPPPSPSSLLRTDSTCQPAINRSHPPSAPVLVGQLPLLPPSPRYQRSWPAGHQPVTRKLYHFGVFRYNLPVAVNFVRVHCPPPFTAWQGALPHATKPFLPLHVTV